MGSGEIHKNLWQKNPKQAASCYAGILQQQNIAHKKTPGDLSLSEFAGFVSCGVVCEIYAVGLEQAVIFPVVMFT